MSILKCLPRLSHRVYAEFRLYVLPCWLWCLGNSDSRYQLGLRRLPGWRQSEYSLRNVLNEDQDDQYVQKAVIEQTLILRWWCENLPREPPTGYMSPWACRLGSLIVGRRCGWSYGSSRFGGVQSSCFLNTGLGNLWEVPVEGSHNTILRCDIVIILKTAGC
jgi:hypothetical protein